MQNPKYYKIFLKNLAKLHFIRVVLKLTPSIFHHKTTFLNSMIIMYLEGISQKNWDWPRSTIANIIKPGKNKWAVH